MKKHNIAILGFGVVGGGVADLVTKNAKELKEYLDCEIAIKRILDLRDFPSSPFASIVTHSYDEIVSDGEIDTVIEVMGGSHPAYEYTVAALKNGKNVISSNKEVVANFGDEFLALAKENGVSYRFEAAVGGGIPVIAPLISCIKQNKVTEIRGILNGTTNYILTKMFTYGEAFDSALKDAQEKGYAERNPDADILGIDASRKITILSALASGRLFKVENVPCEGITKIRKADVAVAEKLGHRIKLLGRCIINGGDAVVMVAPFLLPESSPLASVSGVYNAVEVVAAPLGNVMFYGPGAGAGATASAVVSDLAPIISKDVGLAPKFTKDDYPVKDAFLTFEARRYIAIPAEMLSAAKDIFSDSEFVNNDNEYAIITPAISEEEAAKRIAKLGCEPLSSIRFL